MILFVLAPLAVSLSFAAIGVLVLNYYKKKWDSESPANKEF
jgi:hypothetical protein